MLIGAYQANGLREPLLLDAGLVVDNMRLYCQISRWSGEKWTSWVETGSGHHGWQVGFRLLTERGRGQLQAKRDHGGYETRAGDVFERLLSKLETEREDLKGRVFDVLGKVFQGSELCELLIQAIRYGDFALDNDAGLHLAETRPGRLRKADACVRSIVWPIATRANGVNRVSYQMVEKGCA